MKHWLGYHRSCILHNRFRDQQHHIHLRSRTKFCAPFPLYAMASTFSDRSTLGDFPEKPARDPSKRDRKYAAGPYYPVFCAERSCSYSPNQVYGHGKLRAIINAPHLCSQQAHRPMKCVTKRLGSVSLDLCPYSAIKVVVVQFSLLIVPQPLKPCRSITLRKTSPSTSRRPSTTGKDLHGTA